MGREKKSVWLQMTCRRVSWGKKISLATDDLQKGVMGGKISLATDNLQKGGVLGGGGLATDNLQKGVCVLGGGGSGYR